MSLTKLSSKAPQTNSYNVSGDNNCSQISQNGVGMNMSVIGWSVARSGRLYRQDVTLHKNTFTTCLPGYGGAQVNVL